MRNKVVSDINREQNLKKLQFWIDRMRESGTKIESITKFSKDIGMRRSMIYRLYSLLTPEQMETLPSIKVRVK